MKVGLSFKICFIASGVLLSLAAAQAREASFLAPVPASTSLGAASVQVTPNETFTGKEAVHVPTPQPSPPFQAHIDIQAVKDLDLGDVGLKIAKKATASFVNRGNVSVVLDTVNIATSSNVDYTILHNACAKSTLEIGRSCDIDFEITPKSIGSWALDLALMPYASQALAHLHVAGRSEAIKTILGMLMLAIVKLFGRLLWSMIAKTLLP